MAQFLQPDFSKGDANTVAGYAAVHGRPAAFEGSDGFSYSAEILVDEDSRERERFGGYLFFVRWTRIGASAPEGHLESDILARAVTEPDVRRRVGDTKLSDAKRVLDELITRAAKAVGSAPKRKWWDAMNADDPGDSHGAS